MLYRSSLSHLRFPSIFGFAQINEIRSSVYSFINSPLVSSFERVYSLEERLIYVPNFPDSHLPPFFYSCLNNLIDKVVFDHLRFVPKTCELHIRYPGCSSIPPHQDNFYHCFNSNKSFKFLIPLQPLHPTSGGLIFSDTTHDFPLLDHVPSYQPAFSSTIDPHLLSSIRTSFTSYSLTPGDVTFHSINSIHFAPTNFTLDDSLFLVCRYDHELVSVSDIQRLKYQSVYNKSTGSY